MLCFYFFDVYLVVVLMIYWLVNLEWVYCIFLVGEMDFDGFLYLINGFGDQFDMMEIFKLVCLFKVYFIECFMAYYIEMIEEEINVGIM